ncbi:MAG: NAD-dependent epimerase/dehydratase family protein [Rubripirellula sp.]
MSERRYFITGGLGCIGAETTKWLLKQTSDDIYLCGRDVSDARVKRVFADADLTRLQALEADVTDQASLSRILSDHKITHVVHLAALQTPDCNKHRRLGLEINLGGTQNLIEAMKQNLATVQRFVFASSVAVYGPRNHYSQDRIPMLAEPCPVNVYGAWKLAGEQISRLFAEEAGVPTISLRPGVLFGPGRDAGLTSTPTTAMKNVALNIPYQIPFINRQDYLYAPDVGAAFGNALIESHEGYGAFTLPSHSLKTEQVVDAIRRGAERLGVAEQCDISIGDQSVPFICDLDYQPFCDAFPRTPHTPFEDAVEASIATFLSQAAKGWLQPCVS